jgi:glycosyltransferase involved in cell wall biosynthesis
VGVTHRPRKIVFVTTDLFIGGGAESMLSRLVTAAPRLAEEITIVSLLPGESHTAQLRQAGINVVELAFNTTHGIAAGLIQLAKLISRSRPEIVQGWMYHGDLAALIALVLSGRRGPTRLIWSIRCSDLDLRRYSLGLRLVVKACTLLSRWPDLVTANSSAGLKDHVRLGYRPRRTEVIANGIDIDEFRPNPAAREAVRRELGITEHDTLVAHVARVDVMKDHAAFLTAMAQLADIRAVLIGAGTQNLDRPDNVLALGRRRDVARLLAAADLIVSSSCFGEGFSNAIAEGMACGLPAVATDVGDARLIVGDSGLIVPPRDPQALAAAIGTLAREPAAMRAERATKARTHIVTNYAMTVASRRYAQLYASVA